MGGEHGSTDSISRMKSSIKDLKESAAKAEAMKAKAYARFLERLSGLKEKASKLKKRVEQVEAESFGAIGDAKLQCEEACQQARKRLDRLCREEIPRIEEQGPLGLDLS